MNEYEEALRLTGAIYDAALDPSLWPETLGQIAGFVDAPAAALVSQDIAARKGRFHFSWGDDPHYTRLYFEKYIRINPLLVPMMLLNEGEVRTASRLLPIDRFRTTQFYKEWAGPAGYGDATIAVVEKSPAVVTHITVSHDDRHSPAGEMAHRRVALLAPHVKRAVSIGGALDMHKVEANSLGDAVDAISAGVFLVGEDEVLVRANASGRVMIEAAEIVCLDRGVLNTAATSARRSLHKIIADAVAGGVAVRSQRIAVPLVARSGEPFVAHVLPLNSGKRAPAARSLHAAAAVFVHRASLNGLLPMEALARQFGLSAAELRVLVAVIEVGGGVPEIAGVLGVSEPTVRTHLRRLFDKTGTGRQADLVRLVAGYSNPLLA